MFAGCSWLAFVKTRHEKENGTSFLLVYSPWTIFGLLKSS
jgi:hypothetical protein